jgi:hypothetical protein
MHKENPMDEVRDRLQRGNDLEEAIKMIDSNAAIMGIFKVMRDSYTLAQGWRK